MGFMHFVDALSKFPLTSISMSFGTTETSTTINISDEMVKKLCRMLSGLTGLKDLELNFKHRLSIGSESVLALKDTLLEMPQMTKVHIYLEG